MKAFMLEVERMGRERGCWKEKATDWDLSSINAMWECVRADFMALYCSDSCRPKQLSYKTAYNAMVKAGVFKVPK